MRALVVPGAVTGAMLFLKKGSKESDSIKPVLTQQSTEKITALATWEDPAGFNFSYPENLEIDSHEEDEENYAHLELTSPDYDGRVVIWAQDTSYQDIETWSQKEAADEQVIDTDLGGEPAKKVSYSDPQKVVVATIDVDALVLVEMFPDERGYWQEVYSDILDSFAFIPLESEEGQASSGTSGGGTTSGGAGGQIVVEPEEVIE